MSASQLIHNPELEIFRAILKEIASHLHIGQTAEIDAIYWGDVWICYIFISKDSFRMIRQGKQCDIDFNNPALIDQIRDFLKVCQLEL